ncbi:MAG: hypothetical protein JSW38_13695 [Dehalococcoidia bacterium]|nr:MAG: hypothetical protein JSW38_13695 [Dehalococcoidia bacterium]
MALTIPDDIKEAIYGTWLPALMTTVLKGINELPQEQRENLLTKICTTCEQLAMAGALGIQPGMFWEEYLDYLKTVPAPIGPWTVKQDGDVYDLIYDCTIGDDGKPQCHCPLVQLGMMEPNPYCCDSGARLSGMMIGGARNKQVEKVEVIDSAARTGARICHYRVKLKD